jgi:hypothetical protein
MSTKAAAEVYAQPLADNPVELVNQLGRKISDARINQLNVLSPAWFEKAEEAYYDAKKGLKGARATKLASQARKEAVEQLEATDAFISGNPYAKEEMHEMARKALFLAKRSVVVTEQTAERKLEAERHFNQKYVEVQNFS